MDPLLHHFTLWSATAAAALVSATWQGLVLAACTAVCLRLLPGSGAAARSLLWMGVFLTVVLLHFSPLVLLHLATAHHQAALRVSPIWALNLAAAWLLLSLYRVSRLAVSAVRLRRIAQRATPAACDATCTELLRADRRPVELCLSCDIDRPSVIGFRSPRILLPPTLLSALSSSELQQVILHEKEHLGRNDDWTNLLQKLVLVLFPLNPVLLWIEHRLCTERELACDDGVLRQTHARKAYATCLTHLAEQSVLRRAASLALGAWDQQSELSLRVYRILRQPEATPSTTYTKLLTSALGILLLAVAAELAHSPQLVGFGPQAQQQAALTPISFAHADAGTPAPHLVLAKAILPQPRAMMPQPRSSAHPATHHHSHVAVLTHTIRSLPAASLQAVSIEPVPAPAPLNWVVFTSWQQPTLRLAVQSDIWPSYAAVPVPNGWLIIQL